MNIRDMVAGSGHVLGLEMEAFAHFTHHNVIFINVIACMNLLSDKQ